MRKGNVALTKDEAANGNNYMEPDTGQHKEVDVIVQVVATGDGKKGSSIVPVLICGDRM